jgi:hypothetical protein
MHVLSVILDKIIIFSRFYLELLNTKNVHCNT